MTKQWVTRLMRIGENQLALIPEELSTEQGSDKYGFYATFDGAPAEVATRLQRGIHVTTKPDTKTKSSIIKLLAAAKDTNTTSVYAERVES